MKKLDIYFNDLIPEMQRKLLELVCADSPEELEWDLNPLFFVEVEDAGNEGGEMNETSDDQLCKEGQGR